MLARQISIAPHSVASVAADGEIRVIDRNAEGLWGRWQDAGAGAKLVRHAGQVIARIGPDSRVSAHQRGTDLPWHGWNLTATELTSTHLADGTPVLFAVSDEGRASAAWKPAPVAPWSDWQPLDGPIAGVSAEVIPGGGLVLFGLRDGAVIHRWQDRPLGAWKNWTALGSPGGGARAVAVTTISRGGLALFAIGEDGAVHHRWQDQPFGVWHEWESLGGNAASLSVTRSPAGGLALFTVGGNGAVAHRYQLKPFGEWSKWIDLGGKVVQAEARPAFADGLELFAVAQGGEVRHRWCDRLDVPWADWMPLDFESSTLRLSISPPDR